MVDGELQLVGVGVGVDLEVELEVALFLTWDGEEVVSLVVGLDDGSGGQEPSVRVCDDLLLESRRSESGLM